MPTGSAQSSNTGTVLFHFAKNLKSVQQHTASQLNRFKHTTPGGLKKRSNCIFLPFLGRHTRTNISVGSRNRGSFPEGRQAAAHTEQETEFRLDALRTTNGTQVNTLVFAHLNHVCVSRAVQCVRKNVQHCKETL